MHVCYTAHLTFFTYCLLTPLMSPKHTKCELTDCLIDCCYMEAITGPCLMPFLCCRSCQMITAKQLSCARIIAICCTAHLTLLHASNNSSTLHEILVLQILSDDYSKAAFLCQDRSIHFHAKYGQHYTTRVPSFGRDLAYAPFSADLLVVGSAPEVYRCAALLGTHHACTTWRGL